jgi:phosphoribosylanthranilate isomerase
VSVRLKICGVTRAEDFDVCARAGVDAIGLNFWEGSKRHVTVERARSLCEGRPRHGEGGPTRVGVFVDPEPEALREVWDAGLLDLVQLHGDAPIDRYAGMQLPYVWVIRGTPALAELRIPEPVPAWILLDAVVTGYGGAGQRTDWDWARGAVEHFAPCPVWLAGGITPENAAEAIDAVAPAGLDVASGAEVSGSGAGEKDADAIASLARICKNVRSP